jgi:hypothetical protein
VTFAQKMSVFLKNPIKPQKTRLEVGFLGGFFGVFLAGFLLPTLTNSTGIGARNMRLK